MAVVFLITTIVFAIGWIKYKVAVIAFSYYIETKGYKQPNGDEIAKCSQEVINRILKTKKGAKP